MIDFGSFGLASANLQQASNLSLPNPFQAPTKAPTASHPLQLIVYVATCS